MKILFTGGGSGGHFYPIISIAEEIRAISKEERLVAPQLFFMAPDPYDEGLLFENEIAFIPVLTGKFRRYASWKNIPDAFRTVRALFKASFLMFKIYPDIVVGKGGYGSFPALFAARLWRIPVFIHESDAVPGRVSLWAGKFAARIAVSFQEAVKAFPGGRIAHTGNPIRKALLLNSPISRSVFELERDTRVILVVGGSLGSVALNEALFRALPELLSRYEVIHQTGRDNIADITARAKVSLQESPWKSRYHPFGYLSSSELSSAGRLSHLVISRAGSMIFEIAAWGKPSLLVPLAESSGDHQRENAYAYAENGAADILEESNLTAGILISQVERILGNSNLSKLMSERASHFAKTDAARVIAREILDITLTHEQS
ncbi:MAG: UDP-N-acetylglucosamine--N-acetylmuramyl-(pentapeptide) pyrophosphoryl-undecaprenol N-acetylglucosamine transferase [Patescibacteria group bacterium]